MKKIILIIGLFVLVLAALVNEIRPNFDILEFSRSLILAKQNLPLIKMINTKENLSQTILVGENDYVITGPYWSLPPGKWQVQFKIIPYCQDLNIGYIDVVKEKGLYGYGRKNIVAKENGSSQTEVIEFNNDLGSDYEFRYFSSGRCRTKFVSGELIRENLNLKDIFYKIKSMSHNDFI